MASLSNQPDRLSQTCRVASLELSTLVEADMAGYLILLKQPYSLKRELHPPTPTALPPKHVSQGKEDTEPGLHPQCRLLHGSADR